MTENSSSTLLNITSLSRENRKFHEKFALFLVLCSDVLLYKGTLCIYLSCAISFHFIFHFIFALLNLKIRLLTEKIIHVYEYITIVFLMFFDVFLLKGSICIYLLYTVCYTLFLHVVFTLIIQMIHFIGLVVFYKVYRFKC